MSAIFVTDRYIYTRVYVGDIRSGSVHEINQNSIREIGREGSTAKAIIFMDSCLCINVWLL